MNRKRLLLVAGCTLAVTAIGAPQIKQVIKIFGIGAAVKQFGPDINKAINKLAGNQDSETMMTKVVPIISAGLGSRQSVGAAQVLGPRRQVEKVQAVAQLEQDLLGREVKIRAMIPVSGTDMKSINRVEGVGVSGIVDLKL